MDVPQTRTEVTTSGFYREELDALKDALLHNDILYNGDLTSRTRVLVVHDACASKKFEVAREQQIPCVSSAWVFDAQCCLSRVDEYDVRNTLSRYTAGNASMEICTTGINSTQRAVVRDIASLRGVGFNSVLSRRSCLLVVPSLFTMDDKAPRNDKVEFARRHTIPVMALREYVLRYGRRDDVQQLLERRSQSRSLRSVPTSTYTHATRCSLEPTTPSRHQLREDMADVVVCVLPSDASLPPNADVLSETRTLVALCGASWRDTISDDTTHVLVLAVPHCCPTPADISSSRAHPLVTTSALFPRPGLEAVRVEWLHACLRDQRRHACLSFRVRLIYKPVIVISGISVEKRDGLHFFLQKRDLCCDVQEHLVLRADSPCAQSEPAQPCAPPPPPSTTHLIVPRPALTRSPEVAQLSRERHCGNGAAQCMLVDLEWLLRSIRARKWIDPTFFELVVPPPPVMQQERAKQRRTEGGTGAVYPILSPLGGVCLAADAEDGAAAEAGTQSGIAEEDEEEGASQTAPSQTRGVAYIPGEGSRDRADDIPHLLTLEALLEALESHSMPFDLPCADTATPMVAPSQASCTERNTMTRASPPSSHATVVSATSGKPRSAASSLRFPDTPMLPAEQCGYESQTVVYDHDNVSVAPRQFQADGSSYVRPSITLTECAQRSGSGFPAFDELSKNSRASQGAPWGPSQSTCTKFVLLLSKEVVKEVDWRHLQQQFPTVQYTQMVDECTHFVTNKPAKTEVFLCALAAGKWVVSSSFLTDCMTTGKLVHERNYEWNAKRATAAGHRASVAELVQGCRMQRLAVARPFATWRVLLSCSSATRTVSFAHVLKCGGCTSVQAKSPEEVLDMISHADTNELHNETVVLADDDVWTLAQLEQFAQTYHSKYHHVLRLDYLVHCLFSNSPSSTHFELFRLLQAKRLSHRE